MMAKSYAFSRPVTAAMSLAALLCVACGEGPQQRAETPAAGPPPQGGTDLFVASAMAALPPAGVSAANLPDAESAGAKALLQYCATCHAVPSPAMHSATDWPRVLRRMWLRTDRVAGDFEILVPSTAERAVLLPYLVEHALKVEEAELPAGPGREEFTETCSRCHALADPKQHSPADWVAVARRMRQHAEEMLGITIDPDTFAQIVLYLERVSGS